MEKNNLLIILKYIILRSNISGSTSALLQLLNSKSNPMIYNIIANSGPMLSPWVWSYPNNHIELCLKAFNLTSTTELKTKLRASTPETLVEMFYSDAVTLGNGPITIQFGACIESKFNFRIDKFKV